jgi:hypothetical protein
MGTRLTLPQINKQLDLEKIKKENPSLYASIVEKNKSFNKDIKK